MTSKATNHYNRLNWENAEFAILCETCLGTNPFIRMTKERYGKECKICNRPFTVFRWCPGRGMRYKTTQICQTCSKLKNVCQTCIFDLDYGLPVQVRDNAMKIKDEDVPKSGVNREFYVQNASIEIEKLDKGEAMSKYSAYENQDNPMITKLARFSPNYKRNLPHICSFWVKGSCKRGEECPYRHDKPTDPDDPLANQNIKDRYYGCNDPVANKMLNRYKSRPGISAPEDKTIVTVYIGNIDRTIKESHLRDHFYHFGEIEAVKLAYQSNCGFITFSNRTSAEMAVTSNHNGFIINGKALIINWAKSEADKDSDFNQVNRQVPGLPNSSHFTAESLNRQKIDPTPNIDTPIQKENDESSGKIYYPSQHPNRLGTS